MKTTPYSLEAASFRRTLSRIGSLLGRLGYLASLYDHAARRYRHTVFTRGLNESSAHEIIQAAHWEAFQSWISLSLEDRVSDFDCFLASGEGAPHRDSLKPFWNGGALQRLVPAGARPVERQFFEKEIRFVRELLLSSEGSIHAD